MGKKIQTQKVMLSELSIGTLRFEEVPAWIQSLSAFEEKARHPIRIDALIGLDLLKRTSLTIDYEARKLVFGPIVHEEAAMRFYPGLPFITVALLSGEGSIRLLFDTGTESLILYRTRTAGRIPFDQTADSRRVTYAGGEVSLKKIQLDDVRIGSTQWDRLEAFQLDAPVHSGGLDGILSVSALGLKRLHLDFQQGLMSWAVESRRFVKEVMDVLAYPHAPHCFRLRFKGKALKQGRRSRGGDLGPLSCPAR